MIDLPQISGFNWEAGNDGKSSEKHSVSMSESEQVFLIRPCCRTIGAVLGYRSSASTKRYSHLATDGLKLAIGKIGKKTA